MSNFTDKINRDGTFCTFTGWSIVSFINDDFKFLENYIKKTNLNEYFSPLPSNTYNVTILNISNDKKKQFLNYNYLLYKLYFFCNDNTFDTIKLKIEKIYYDGLTLGIKLKNNSNLDKI